MIVMVAPVVALGRIDGGGTNGDVVLGCIGGGINGGGGTIGGVWQQWWLWR
jgi:hypothetical protein